jgi:hypothetical protein
MARRDEDSMICDAKTRVENVFVDVNPSAGMSDEAISGAFSAG